MRNRIGIKIIGGYVLFVILILTFIGTRYWVMTSTAARVEKLHEEAEEMRMEMETENLLWQQVAAMSDFLVEGEEENVVRLENFRKQFSEHLDNLEPLFADNSEEREKLAYLRIQYNLFNEKFAKAAKMYREGRKAEALRVEIEEIDPVEQNVEAIIEQLVELQKTHIEIAVENVRATQKYARIFPFLSTTIENSEKIYNRNRALQNLLEAESIFWKQDIAVTDLFLFGKEEFITEFYELEQSFGESLEREKSFADSPRKMKLLNTLEVSYKKLDESFDKTAALYHSDNRAATLQLKTDVVDHAERDVQTVLVQLTEIEKEDMRASLSNVRLMDATTFAVTKDMAIYVIILMFAALVCGIIIALKITRPIGQLVKATQKLAVGDFNARAQIESRNEIGDLANSFNQMAENLQKTIVSKDDLEAKIKERTIELEQVNEILQSEIIERRKAEETLGESAANYRQLADAMPQIVWTARPDGYIDYFNQRSFEYMGMMPEQTGGWGWLTVLHPDDLESCTDAWSKAVETGEKYKVEYRFKRTSDGEYRWHLGQALPVRDTENRIVKWFGTYTDIHEQKKLEEELWQIQEELELRVKGRTLDLEQVNYVLKQEIVVREQVEQALSESTKRERAIIENALDVICTVNAEGRFVTINPACFKIWGYQPEELIGCQYIDFVAPEDVAETNEVALSIISGKEATNFENRYRHKNGTLINTRWTSHWSESEQLMFAVAHDITGRKKIEYALLESEQKYRELIENANDVLYTLNLSGGFTSLNRTGEQITKYTRAEALQMNIADVIAPKDVMWWRERIAKNIKGAELPNFELEIITKDGGTVTLDISTRLIVQDGVPTGIQGIGRDITERKQAEKQLQESELRYRMLFDNNPNPVFVFDLETLQFLAVNKEMIHFYGYSHEEFLQMSLKDIRPPEDIALMFEKVAASIASGNKLIHTIRHRKKDGTIIEAEIAAHSVTYAGRAARIVLVTDITERKRADAALRESEYKLRTLVGSMSEGLLEVNKEDRITFVNPYFCEMVGYAPDELIGADWCFLMIDDEKYDFVTQINDRRRKGISDRYELSLKKKSGEIIWVIVGGVPVVNADGNIDGSMGVFTDITERKRAEKQLLHDAFHDALTGLANRALFMDHLRMTIERGKSRHSNSYAVLFLDFDRFKVINDSLGHTEGDHLLKQIARRLESSTRTGDLVARLGGDEFVVLLSELAKDSDAVETAERIQDNLKRPFDLSGSEIFISASIGIALSTAKHKRAEDMIRDADIAMYRAKASGRAQHQVFDRAMHEHASKQLQLETQMRRALKREEFLLHFQPIINLKTETLTGFEALVRWKHSERGMIPPFEFIGAAEENGLILPLGKWILQESCRQLRLWQVNNPAASGLTVSVNLSSKQFSQSDLAKQIAETLEKTGLNPRCLKLEITESHIMENTEMAAATMSKLCALGVELSLDDFGTGYSSLSYLHRLPVNYLKIDRSFVSRMIESEENLEIVHTIIKLAQNLKMKVVAEGIETAEQLAQLKMLNCEYGQGYFFAKPMEAVAAKIYIDKSLKNSPYITDHPVINAEFNM